MSLNHSFRSWTKNLRHGRPLRPRYGKKRRTVQNALRHIEKLEDRTLLSVAGGFGDEGLIDSASFDQTEPPQFVAGEILLGFGGPVAARFAGRGAAAALHAASRQVSGFGLRGPNVLFELPGTENRPARLATRWLLPAGADVLEVAAQVSAL